MIRQGYTRLPCGCEMWNEGPDGVEFVFKPHSPDCEYYLYAMERSRSTGIPVEYRFEKAGP